VTAIVAIAVAASLLDPHLIVDRRLLLVLRPQSPQSATRSQQPATCLHIL